MTSQEEYSAIINKLFRENGDNKERLDEMVFWLFNPSPHYDPAIEDFQAGDSKYQLVQVEGIWEIQIKDIRGHHAGHIAVKDGFLIHSSKDASRVVTYKANNGHVEGFYLFEIIMDNF